MTGTKLKMNKVDYEENGWHSPPTVLFAPIVSYLFGEAKVSVYNKRMIEVILPEICLAH